MLACLREKSSLPLRQKFLTIVFYIVLRYNSHGQESFLPRKMPVTKSAKKKVRRDRRRNLINKKIRQQMKAAVKVMRKKPTKKALQKASQALDRAAKKGMIHKNKASRLKSRLAKLLQKGKKSSARKTKK